VGVKNTLEVDGGKADAGFRYEKASGIQGTE
jgi:hypothetical protein